MGEFELALVFYHRGKKLRGDVKEFQMGINKAQEAIDNCVGGELIGLFLSEILISIICFKFKIHTLSNLKLKVTCPILTNPMR